MASLEGKPSVSRRWLIGSVVLNVFLLASALGLGFGWPLFLHVKQVLPRRERHVSFFAQFPIASGDVVFVGDALTDEGRWSELFAATTVKNRGVDGDTTEDVAYRIGQVAAGKPRKVFLMIGGEDAAAGKSVDETAASYRAILSRLRTESPATEVYAQSILPRSEDARDDVRARNDAIRRVAEENGATFVDLVPLFADESGRIRPDLSNDRAHLLGPGYEVWRDAIAPHVTGPRPR